MSGVEASDYEAVIEQHVREALGLGPDDPLPPPGPVAIATEIARERERPFVEELTRQLPAYREAWSAVMRLAATAGDGPGRPEFVWRDPAPR